VLLAGAGRRGKACAIGAQHDRVGGAGWRSEDVADGETRRVRRDARGAGVTGRVALERDRIAGAGQGAGPGAQWAPGSAAAAGDRVAGRERGGVAEDGHGAGQDRQTRSARGPWGPTVDLLRPSWHATYRPGGGPYASSILTVNGGIALPLVNRRGFAVVRGDQCPLPKPRSLPPGDSRGPTSSAGAGGRSCVSCSRSRC